MLDFRLRVFYTVAKRLNFTKAAEELFISQPAVTKHIQELEKVLQTKLFDRNGTKIKLNQAGLILLQYAEQALELYRGMERKIHQLQEKHKGELRLGVSTSIAQYILPKILAKFRHIYPDITVNVLINNTEITELLLAENQIDFGIIEGYSKNNLFSYDFFAKDEIVLIEKDSAKSNLRSISIKDLTELKFVIRETGSGTLEYINHHLKSAGINPQKLTTEIELSNTESIKSYLQYSDCVAFLSISSVLQELKNRSLRIIDVKNLEITRDFLFIKAKGDQNSLSQLFIDFAKSYNLK